MILRDRHDFTVLHLFSGSGGGALGFKRAGFRSLRVFVTSSHHRGDKHIGNAVPPDAAEAVAVECMVALMSSADGGYHLSNGNIWVRPEMEWAA